ncbi:MAG: 5-formyltetrahydrofolate cyclo-ligase [Methylococcales bacterium]
MATGAGDFLFDFLPSGFDFPAGAIELDHLFDRKALDLIMVPGVAFDATGARLGNGRGYYDRLFAEVRPDCPVSGVGFESQIFAEIPMDRFDIHLDGVMTEAHFYRVKAAR